MYDPSILNFEIRYSPTERRMVFDFFGATVHKEACRRLLEIASKCLHGRLVETEAPIVNECYMLKYLGLKEISNAD